MLTHPKAPVSGLNSSALGLDDMSHNHAIAGAAKAMKA
jgi:hypothetical protein